MRNVKPEKLGEVKKLRSFCAWHQIRQVDIAAALGVSKQYISAVMSGRKGMSEARAREIWDIVRRLARADD